MRAKVYRYFESKVNEHNLKDVKTLDIGSLDINGTLKPLFTDYTGIDMRKGKNVDIVANGHDLPFNDDTFDCVITAETFEHDDKFWITMKEIKRVLKSGGWLIIAVPNIGFHKHNHPSDYWRFTDSALESLLNGFSNVEATENGDATFAIGQWKY